MRKKLVLYTLIWLLIMLILSSDMFSYYATRKLVKGLALSMDPHIPVRAILNFHKMLRKFLHVFNYAVLSWLILCVWVRSFRPISLWKPRIGFFCIFLCLIVSVADEWRQSFSQVRTPLFSDVGLDVLGAFLLQLGCYFKLIWRRKIPT
jgi:VanZ family protein